MHVGWTRPGPSGIVPGLDGSFDDGPRSVRGALMDYDEAELAGDGELFYSSPYLSYRPEDTRVVKYVLGSEPENPVTGVRGWTWMRTAREARHHCTQRYGRILEEHAAGDHVFFRVHKERK